MTKTNNEQLNELTALHKWFVTHKRHGGQVFPTFASLKWFVRQHKVVLVDAEVLVPGKGSRSTLVTSGFGQKVYELLVHQ